MPLNSEVEICNAALAALGEAPLSSLDEPREAARLARARYGVVRDAVLRAHPWNFAIARALLAPLDEVPAFGFAASYALPADCLRVLEAGTPPAAWRVEGRRLLTDQEAPLAVLYVRRAEEPGLYDPLFVEALAARLGADLAMRITENASRAAALWDLYQAKLREARTVDAREGTADALPDGSWLEARR
jgi:hypothetical protein